MIHPSRFFIWYFTIAVNLSCKILSGYLLAVVVCRLLKYFDVSSSILGFHDGKKIIHDKVDELKQLLQVHKEEWSNEYEKILEHQRQTHEKLELIEKQLINQRQEFYDSYEILQFLLMDIQTAAKNQEKQIELMVNLLLDLKNKNAQPEKKEKEKNSNCTICLERPLNICIRPCGHVCCQICLKKHKQKHKECPFCRSNMEDTLQLYFP